MKIEKAHAEMSPNLLRKALIWEGKMKMAKLPFAYTNVARVWQVHFALFAQGRDTTENVNMYRAIAGMMSIPTSQNKQVTWTLESRHLVRLDDGRKANDKSSAFDFAIVKGRSTTWDVKADVNSNNIEDYLEAGTLIKEAGLEWGGFWPKPDYCHGQLLWAETDTI
jgi:hypothetical protein